MAKTVRRLRREEPLPSEMQGRWVSVDEPEPQELFVDGGEITCFGMRVEYDYKDIIEHDSGDLEVDLGIDDKSQHDDFRRRHITGLIIFAEGGFTVYNVRFGCDFERPKA
ncbi:hypothetical protein BH10PSE6_BH10PSE6_28380 [soil metagenome]